MALMTNKMVFPFPTKFVTKAFHSYQPFEKLLHHLTNLLHDQDNRATFELKHTDRIKVNIHTLFKCIYYRTYRNYPGLNDFECSSISL